MKNYFLIIVPALITLGACRKDFVVEDISKKSVIVNSPVDNLVTSSNTVTFWWDEVDGAEEYNLQIVQPGFAALTRLIADTTISYTRINISLQPGSYQWRIKAKNAGHSTAFQTYNLKIDSSNVLTNQLVIPLSPPGGFITREKVLTFSWNSLAAATSYSIELKMSNSVINNSTTVGTSYTFTFPITTNSVYPCSWRVKAINASSISQYNTAQTFTIDVLPPPVSTPSLPVNNMTVTDTVHLRWKRNGADARSDSLYIYSDAAFLNVVKKLYFTNTSVKINQLDASNPLPAGTSSASPISYWWRLRTLDSLGNTSGFGNAYSFLLHQ